MQLTITKTILSLCDYSGAWSQPYMDAGYEVNRIDLQYGGDVRLMKFPGRVHGILAAPPCRVFCRPGARLWKEWGDKELLDGLSVVDACLRLVAVCRPAWWALENPPGRLDKYLGPPSLSSTRGNSGTHTRSTPTFGDGSRPRLGPRLSRNPIRKTCRQDGGTGRAVCRPPGGMSGL